MDILLTILLWYILPTVVCVLVCKFFKDSDYLPFAFLPGANAILLFGCLIIMLAYFLYSICNFVGIVYLSDKLSEWVKK